VAVGVGHGGFQLGQIALFSPLSAFIVAVIVAVIFGVAWRGGYRAFTLVASGLAALVLIPAGLMILLDGPALVAGISTLPLVVVWVIVVLRGIYSAYAARRRLAV